MSAPSTTQSLAFASQNWPKPIGLIASLILWTLVALAFVAVFSPLGTLAVLLIGYAVISSVWWRTTRHVPRAPKNKIGFAVAISCEDDKLRRQVASDFVITLQTLIKNSASGRKFAFIPMPERVAARVLDREGAEWLREKSKCSFIIFGRVRDRKIAGSKHYVINLNGSVAHRPLSEEVQKTFVQEFTELFPRNLTIDEGAGFLGFDFTTKWAHLVAKYVIGLAMALSGFFAEADPMLAEAGRLATQGPANFPAFARIRGRVPGLRAAMQVSQARQAYDRWRNGNFANAVDLRRAKDHIEEAIRLDPACANTPLVLVHQSVLAFVEGRNCPQAHGLLDRVPKPARDAAWHFNKGFLYAYQGNLKEARHCYTRGSRLTVPPQLVTEVKSFISWILAREPDRYELYFSLGLLNRTLKDDEASAIRDFEAFLERVPHDRFEAEQRATRSWIAQMRQPS